MDLGADRVAGLGPVDRHVGDPVPLLVEDHALVGRRRRPRPLRVVMGHPSSFVGRSDDRQVVGGPGDLAAAPLGELLGGIREVEVGLDRGDLLLGLDDVADHQGPRLLADPPEQGALRVVLEVVDREHGDHEVPGPVRQGVLHARQLDVVVLLAQPVDHVRARVESDHPGVGIGLQQDPGGLAGAHAELEDSVGRERDRVDRGSLKLVVARDLGPDLLQVGLRIPVELRAQGVSLPSGPSVCGRRNRRSRAPGAVLGTGPRARSGGGARADRARRTDLLAGGRRLRGAARRFADQQGLRAPASLLERADRSVCPLSGGRGDGLRIDAREVDQPRAEDEELRSPYVSDGELDVGRWANDALVLALPSQPLCRPDCAGLCAVCGESLNDADPEAHRPLAGRRPPDGKAPRPEARLTRRAGRSLLGHPDAAKQGNARGDGRRGGRGRAEA